MHSRLDVLMVDICNINNQHQCISLKMIVVLEGMKICYDSIVLFGTIAHI